MPTRFTAPIYDGEDITFEQFANSCLRNFGIYLRFEGKYPNLSRYEIPDKICPSDYYKKKYEEAKAEYEKHLASPKTKEELEAEYLSYVNDVIKGNEAHQVNPSTVCQFTGMRDCEGKEIWESDIVHDNYDRLCIDNLYEVVYIEEEGTFAFKSLDKVDNYEPFVNLFEVYVVGNKFDKEK